jgi:hypothetical protein
MSFNYLLVGGQVAGGDDKVFTEKARDAWLGEFEGRGFLVVDPDEWSGRRFGHARVALAAANPISLSFHRKDEQDRPVSWAFRGTVYRGNEESIEELRVFIVGYSFSGTVRLALVEAPPASVGVEAET